jgi:hypothetical protein
VWVNGLPPEAAVWRVDGQQWTTLHELLALQAELIDQWGLLGARIQTGGKGLPKKGLQIPRPGEAARTEQVAKDDRVVTDPAEIARFFG